MFEETHAYVPVEDLAELGFEEHSTLFHVSQLLLLGHILIREATRGSPRPNHGGVLTVIDEGGLLFLFGCRLLLFEGRVE